MLDASDPPRPPPVANRVRSLRRHRDWSQAYLARALGISRQAMGSIDRGDALPSLELALRLAALFRVPLEELFVLQPTGESPFPNRGEGPPPGTRVRRVEIRGSTVLLPAPELGNSGPEWAHGVIDEAGHFRPLIQAETPSPGRERTATTLVLAGCDPATRLLQQLLSASREMELIWLPVGSRRALHLLSLGKAHIAGDHLTAGRADSPSVDFPTTRVAFAHWEQGILLRAGNPLGIETLQDLARPRLRFLNREPGSGSRAMLDRLLQDSETSPADIPGYLDTAAGGHWAVAQAISSNLADAGVGIRAAAKAFGLDWIPLETERYDLVFPTAAAGEPALLKLLDLLRCPALRSQVESLGGYDVAPMGRPF